MQPHSITKPLLPSTIELVYSVSISKESECWSVSNVLCCFWTLINISINKYRLRILVTEITEGRKNISTNMAPGSSIANYRRCFPCFELLEEALEVIIITGTLQISMNIHREDQPRAFQAFFNTTVVFCIIFDRCHLLLDHIIVPHDCCLC